MTRFIATAAIVAALVLLAAPAGAGEGYTTLYACLVDLDGWTGGDPEGMEMSMPGMQSVTAIRNYEAEEREATVSILVGNMAAISGMSRGATAGGMARVETEEGKFETREVDGWVTWVVFDKEERAGNVTVRLFGDDEEHTAVFVVSFEGMDIEEGYELAKEFDWADIKKRVASLK